MSDTQAAPETSVEDRLAGFFSQEPEAAPEPEDTAPEETLETSAETEEAAPEENAEAPSDEVEEFVTDEGKAYQVPKDLKPYLERRADYSRKTAELAVLREQAQDRLHYAEARERLMGAVSQELGQLQMLQSQVAQLQQVDTTHLTLEQKWDLRERQSQIERQLAVVTQAVQSKVQKVNEQTASHEQWQWEMAQRGFIEKNGKVSQEENLAMLRTVQEAGFQETELRKRFADPRFLALVHKAAKWDSLQQGKPLAVAKAAKAPPVVKPGAVSSGSSQERQYKQVRAAFKKSGSVSDAARLLRMRMK